VESNADFAVCEPAPALRDYVSHYVGFRAREFAPYTHSGLPSHHLLLAISLARPVDLVRLPCAEQPPAVCGFHDQAHMTLEWNSLAGCTPGTWIVNELPFFQYAEPRTGE
jgi:hypothetical protein